MVFLKACGNDNGTSNLSAARDGAKIAPPLSSTVGSVEKNMDESPKQLFIADVDFPEAKRLADLASILRDLQVTVETCKRVVNLLESAKPDSIVIEGLWSAALIRYVRCFAFGKRYGLTEDIFKDLNGDPIGAHRWYKNMRDKHIAHSVNPYEQVRIGIILSSEDSQEQKVLGVSTLAGSYISPDKKGVEQLGMLATVLIKTVGILGKECENKVLDMAKNLPIDQLYNRATSKFVAPGPEKAGKARIE